MGEKLESIVFQNQLSSAGGLIGKRVGGLSTENTRVAGTVKSVSRVGDQIGLLLHNNWVIPMDNVEYIDQQPSTGPGSSGG